jgi:hypothetical protein
VRRSFTLENDAHTISDSQLVSNHKVFVDHFFVATCDAGIQCRHERLRNKRVTPFCSDEGVCSACIIEQESLVMSAKFVPKWSQNHCPQPSVYSPGLASAAPASSSDVVGPSAPLPAGFSHSHHSIPASSSRNAELPIRQSSRSVTRRVRRSNRSVSTRANFPSGLSLAAPASSSGLVQPRGLHLISHGGPIPGRINHSSSSSGSAAPHVGFVRAASVNAHNPFLHQYGSPNFLPFDQNGTGLSDRSVPHSVSSNSH